MEQYSVAVMLPGYYTRYIKNQKDQLHSLIGWYHSRNSRAHVTVVEFRATDKALKEAIAYITKFCEKSRPFSINFNCIDILGRALCVLPSLDSGPVLKAVMKAFSAKFPLECGSSSTPHITIGRRLAKDQLGLGRNCFAQEKPEISFLVDGLCLRRFDEARKQYDVIAKFGFRGLDDAPPIVYQPTLFL